MAVRGARTTWHGAFASKADARRKEAELPGAFIQETTIRGRRRYLVRTPAAAPARRKAGTRRTTRTRRPARPNAGDQLIYAEVLEVVARKGPGHLNCDPACKRAKHTYVHKFSSRPKLYGAADGSLIIRH